MMSTKTTSNSEILLVWGFIRTLKIIYEMVNIHIEIYEMIYLFQKPYEHFGQTNEQHTLNETKTIISASDTFTGYGINAFGAVIIDSTIETCHVWKFHFLKKIKGKWGFGVGIVDNDYVSIEWPIFLCKGNAYGWGAITAYASVVDNKEYHKDMDDGGSWEHKAKYATKPHSMTFKDDDIVEMKLNMKCKVLSITVSQDTNAIERIGVKDGLKYRMGIYLHGGQNEVELVEYREYLA